MCSVSVKLCKCTVVISDGMMTRRTPIWGLRVKDSLLFSNSRMPGGERLEHVVDAICEAAAGTKTLC